MISLLRLISFIFGAALALAPSFLFLQFSYGVGDQPSLGDVLFAIPALIVGLLLGGGLLLVGVPDLVKGPSSPAVRFLAGSLVALSALAIMIFGFSGSITRAVSPAILFIEVCVFYVFVYPAKKFPSGAENG